MLKISLIGLLSFFVFESSARVDEAVVIEVRKKVKLHDMERVYADYFIKGGTKLGLSEGVIISVLRRLPVHDPFDHSSVGDFKVKVADIEIIQVDADKSIGRLVEIDRREARPMLADDAIMIGDRLDLDSMRAKVSYREAPSSVFTDYRIPKNSGSLSDTVPENQPMMDRAPASLSPEQQETMKNIDSLLTKPQQ